MAIRGLQHVRKLSYRCLVVSVSNDRWTEALWVLIPEWVWYVSKWTFARHLNIATGPNLGIWKILSVRGKIELTLDGSKRRVALIRIGNVYLVMSYTRQACTLGWIIIKWIRKTTLAIFTVLLIVSESYLACAACAHLAPSKDNFITLTEHRETFFSVCNFVRRRCVPAVVRIYALEVWLTKFISSLQSCA